MRDATALSDRRKGRSLAGWRGQAAFAAIGVGRRGYFSERDRRGPLLTEADIDAMARRRALLASSGEQVPAPLTVCPLSPAPGRVLGFNELPRALDVVLDFAVSCPHQAYWQGDPQPVSQPPDALDASGMTNRVVAFAAEREIRPRRSNSRFRRPRPSDVIDTSTSDADGVAYGVDFTVRQFADPREPGHLP